MVHEGCEEVGEMDGKCYRKVWTLRQINERGVNMQKVRKDTIIVKSVERKIEKRVIERIGHMMRMGNERLTSAMVLGRWKRLTRQGKIKVGRRRRCCSGRECWDASVDWTDVERLTGMGAQIRLGTERGKTG